MNYFFSLKLPLNGTNKLPYQIFDANTLWIFSKGIWHIFSAVAAGVCVCVCVCLFILFHLLVSSGFTTSVTYVRCSDQRSFVVSIIRGFCQVHSSLFLNLSYFTSKDENSSWQLLERKQMI